MVAFSAADHAAAEVLDVSDVTHQLVVDIRQQKVSARNRPLVRVPQLVDQMIQSARDIGLGVEIGVLSEQRQRLAVKDHFDSGEPAGAGGVELVRPFEVHRARARQQEFLMILGDDSRLVSYPNEMAFCAAR